MIQCKTYCNRLFRCSDYSESDRLDKQINRIFENILDKIKLGESLVASYVKEYSRSYSGNNYIHAEHRKEFEANCQLVLFHLKRILETFKLDKIKDEYCYKYKIKGNIGAVVGNLNLHFSYEIKELTENELDFAELNNYFYNIVKKKKNDLIVISLLDGTSYYIKYNPKKYNIKRGLVGIVKNMRLKRSGPHCRQCKKSCKFEMIPNIERSIIKILTLKGDNMIDIVTKTGKKIGTLSDSSTESDTIIVNGKEVKLEDAYNSAEIVDKFNTQVKELNGNTTTPETTEQDLSKVQEPTPKE